MGIRLLSVKYARLWALNPRRRCTLTLKHLSSVLIFDEHHSKHVPLMLSTKMMMTVLKISRLTGRWSHSRCLVKSLPVIDLAEYDFGYDEDDEEEAPEPDDAQEPEEDWLIEKEAPEQNKEDEE